MTAKILNGREIAAAVRAEAAAKAAALADRGVVPGLAVILVGDDGPSAIYVRNKARAAASVGVTTFDHKLPASTTQRELLDLVARYNEDERCDGILVQLPLPAGIDPDAIQDAIAPNKDVDGFTADNIGRLAQGRPRFVAATPKGCMRLLTESGMALAGVQAVVVGRSNIVGKPMAMLLTNASATVTVCHSRTASLEDQVRAADVVVAAIGRAETIRGAWIKLGAVVIDVGINRTADGALVGDVEFGPAAERASAITPVPGGVGPMTIASLLDNTVESARGRVQ